MTWIRRYLSRIGILDDRRQSAERTPIHVGARLDLDDLGYERRRYSGFGAYNASKLANVIFARTLARRLGRSEVRVNAVHPGEAATAIARDYGRIMTALMRVVYRAPKVASSTTLFAATAAEADVSGHFFRDGRVAPYSPLADDVQLQERLWSVREAMIRAARGASPAPAVAGLSER